MDEYGKRALTIEDFNEVLMALARFRSKAAEARFTVPGKGMSYVSDIVTNLAAELSAIRGGMEPLYHSCWNCSHPHCRYVKPVKTTYCSFHPDVCDHAHESEDAELNVCENWNGVKKRNGWCLYEYGCQLNKDGKCTLKTWCAAQGNKTQYESGVRANGRGFIVKPGPPPADKCTH